MYERRHVDLSSNPLDCMVIELAQENLRKYDRFTTGICFIITPFENIIGIRDCKTRSVCFTRVITYLASFLTYIWSRYLKNCVIFSVIYYEQNLSIVFGVTVETNRSLLTLPFITETERVKNVYLPRC